METTTEIIKKDDNTVSFVTTTSVDKSITELQSLVDQWTANVKQTTDTLAIKQADLDKATALGIVVPTPVEVVPVDVPVPMQPLADPVTGQPLK